MRILSQTATGNDRDAGAFNQMLTTQIERLKKVSQIVKQYTQGSSQPVQATIEGQLFKYNNSLVIRHI